MAQVFNWLAAKRSNFLGKSARFALKPIQKLFSLKKVVQLGKQSVYACHVMFDQNVWNTPSLMTSDLEFGVVYPNANVDASSAVQRSFPNVVFRGAVAYD
jgi:hypothetical protein